MTIGEKIKYYRKMQGLTQETLGKLSGIIPETIKKYERGDRNPKPKQLLKIANALGVSIYVFMDFDIKTVADALAVLTKLDESIDMKVNYIKNKDGNLKEGSLTISFDDENFNRNLFAYTESKASFISSIHGPDTMYLPANEYEEHISLLTDEVEKLRFELLSNDTPLQKIRHGLSFGPTMPQEE